MYVHIKKGMGTFHCIGKNLSDYVEHKGRGQ